MPNATAAVNARPSEAPAVETVDRWVFGYGSLMWRPGFEYEERHCGRLMGAHRALCVLSHVHRGTPEQPGLVLGLDHGGQCRGFAYRVAPERWDETLSYLRAREQATRVYREVHRRVTLESHPDRVVRALVYVVDRSHAQYAGDLPLERQLQLVRQGHGRSGPNREYVLSTVAALAALGLRDEGLHWLAERL